MLMVRMKLKFQGEPTAVPKEQLIALNTYVSKEESPQINDLSFTLRSQKKNKLQSKQKEETTKVSAEINEIGNRIKEKKISKPKAGSLKESIELTNLQTG